MPPHPFVRTQALSRAPRIGSTEYCFTVVSKPCPLAQDSTCCDLLGRRVDQITIPTRESGCCC